MKVIKFEDEKDWLEARLGRITGTRLKDLVNKRSTEPKIGYYELIAERVCQRPSEENVMDRGKRLEEVALEQFASVTGKKVKNDLVLWHRDDDHNIAVSPDGTMGKIEAAEVKCLSSALHIKAWLTKQIPSDYEFQKLQYFIVNDKLKTLWFVFYDPRMPIDLFWIEVKREDVQAEVDEYLALERKVLAEISEIENKLTF